RTMDVEVMAYSESSKQTTIRRGDGQVFTVPISMFDENSQKQIIEIAPAPKASLAARLSVGKRRERKEDSSYMKIQTLTGQVVIQNKTLKIDFKGKGSAFLVARQTARYKNREEDYGKILAREDFDINVAGGKEFRFECEPIKTEYDSDRDDSNIGGWEYYGWLLIIQDSDGEVYLADTSIGNLKTEIEESELYAEQLLSLQKDQQVEKNLQSR
ncbi:MAG: hypothetical protein AAF226_10845, partial [Verrucomicrobiota bacterium]